MATTVTSTTTSSVKPGIQTTEFILTIVANIFTIFLTFKGMIPANIAAIVIASVTGIYTIMRSIVKIYDPSYVASDLPTPPAAGS